MGTILRLGRSPGGGHDNPSCLENPTDRGDWLATVHGVTKSWTRLKWFITQHICCQNVYQNCVQVLRSSLTQETILLRGIKKGLGFRFPRFGCQFCNLSAIYSNSHLWRRKWQPIPVFLPGEFHGRRSLVGYSPWVAKSWTQLSDFTFTSENENILLG